MAGNGAPRQEPHLPRFAAEGVAGETGRRGASTAPTAPGNAGHAPPDRAGAAAGNPSQSSSRRRAGQAEARQRLGRAALVGEALGHPALAGRPARADAVVAP